MEYEIVIKVKVDTDYFYWDLNPAERQEVIADEIRSIIYDADDIKVLSAAASELEE